MQKKEILPITSKSTKLKFNSLYSNSSKDQIQVLHETAQYLRMTNSQINDNIQHNHKKQLSSLKSFFLTPSMVSNGPLPTEATSNSNTKRNRKVLLLSPELQGDKFHSILKINKKSYCPFCNHCNTIKDDAFNKLHYHYKETSDFIAKSAQYILKEKYEAFSSFFNENFHLGNDEMMEKEKKEYNTIESLLYHHPKHQSPQTKEMYKVLNMFLHSLINNNTSLEEIIKGTNNDNDALMNKFIKGFSYDESNDKVLLDPEFEEMFDAKTKEKLIEVIKEEYLNKVSPLRAQIAKSEVESNKKLLVLFLVLTQCLSETFNESKDRAVLLFKVFKMYCVELHKKLMNVIDNFKAQNEYYKELCRGIIKERTPDINNIDFISNTLSNSDVSVDNIQKHKEAIKILLSEVHRYQDNYYTIKSQLGLEASFWKKWIYGYEKLKTCYNLQQSMKALDINQIADFIRQEVETKDYPEEIILLLINVEIFQRVSGVKNYLFEQKNFYQKELARLNDINQNLLLKKKKYKANIVSKEKEWLNKQIDYEEQILSFKARLNQKTTEMSTQTEVDYFTFNKYQKSNEIIENHKRLTTNKIDDYLLRIKYKCSRYFPLSKNSLLKLIPELFNEKKEYDLECEKTSQPKLFFNEFVLNYFAEKFKLRKIIQQNTEETIMAILKYSQDDKRIDYFRRFLAIGSDPIRKEVFDIALIILSELPFSYYKIYYEDKYDSFLLSTDFALDILYTRFKLFYFAKLNFRKIIFNSNIYDKTNHKIQKVISSQNKESVYYLYRLYQRGNIFINDLLLNLKNNSTNKVNVMELIKHLQSENQEYELSYDTCYSALENNFTINQEDNTINLTEFCNFFLDRKSFKISAFEFIEICISKALLLYNYLEMKANRVFESVDVKKKQILNQKQFKQCIEEMIGNQTNNWKMNEFFSIATHSGGIGFVGKEEFIDFVLNTNDMLMPLIKQYIVNNSI